ncbi:MAG: T9SS type A sorting domain-containing protein [Candidatus Azobacteroides sp.]|nr:T9SS type A sorting domain-containing protein [Candidatus Azobacteroides sp.]
MKKIIFLFVSVLISNTYYLFSQTDFSADFDTFDTTPYVFRFGNNTNPDYYPRWQYSHLVVDNPLINADNPSEKVLEYTSLEARWYGLKVRFSAPMNISDIDTIRFRIYQPENIIGKEVHAGYSTVPATSQEIRVKLLTYFNTIMDQREDDGVVLTFNGAVQPFFTTGEWVTYEVVVDESKFAQAHLNLLKNGVLGIAIMPSYNDGVTLASRYTCYIDNIEVKKHVEETSLSEVEEIPFVISYGNGNLLVRSMMNGEADIKVYDLKGSVVQDFGKNELAGGLNHYPLGVPAGMYVASLQIDGKYFNRKILVAPEK